LVELETLKKATGIQHVRLEKVNEDEWERTYNYGINWCKVGMDINHF